MVLSESRVPVGCSRPPPIGPVKLEDEGDGLCSAVDLCLEVDVLCLAVDVLMAEIMMTGQKRSMRYWSPTD